MWFQSPKARRESKWHLGIESAVRQSKAASAHSETQDQLLPRATLQTFTKSYLGKKKLTQQQKDAKLEKLIASYTGKREDAFTACSADLSPDAIERYLESTFVVHPTNLQGLASWLHAFTSAAQSRSDLFSFDDQRFAVAVLPAATQTVDDQVQPAGIQALFDAWDSFSPTHSLLRQRARALTQRIVRQIEKDLVKFNDELARGIVSRGSCFRAIENKNILARVKAAESKVKTQLDTHLGEWRRWAVWHPSLNRLLRWAENPSNGPFSMLLELEGPDMESQPAQQCRSKWQALVQTGNLISWLEGKRYKPAIGLVTGDTEKMLTDFIGEFLETASLSGARGSPALLQYLISRDGLDLHPLKSWRAVDSLLSSGVVALLTEKPPFRPDADTLMVQCLKALSKDFSGTAREAVKHEAATAIIGISNMLLHNFNGCVLTTGEWLKPAQRLWQLLNAVDSSAWLHAALNQIDQTIVLRSRFQASERNLEALAELQTQIAGRKGDLGKDMVEYIQAYVKKGCCIADEAKAFPKTLHDVWIARPSGAVRETTLLIASLDGVSQTTQLSCIKDLQTANPLNVQSVHEFLNNIVAGESSAIVEMTHFIARILLLSIKEHWTDLLRALITRLAISPQDEEFVALGFTTYRDWIVCLHELLGDVDQLEQIHSWLDELREFETEIKALGGLPDSKAALINMMISHKNPAKKQHLKMLRCLQSQKDDDRKELLQNLYLTLRACQLSLVSQAIQAVSEVHLEGFKSCESLLNQVRENRTLASVRLATWLRAPQIDSDNEAALRSLGKLLKLIKDKQIVASTSGLAAARKYYIQRVDKLVETTQRLEEVRMVLQRKDPVSVDTLIDELGLERPKGVEVLMQDLPGELISFVEATAEDEIEMSFPLTDPNVNAMQRLGLGLDGAETLSVHLRIVNANQVVGICVHVHESEVDAGEGMHSYYEGDQPPMESYCYGRPSRLRHLVSGALWHLVQTGEDHSIEWLYGAVILILKTAGSRCMICGTGGSARLHRPGVCGSQPCQEIFLSLDLETRLQDLRSDGLAVDLLLASISAIASGGNLGLLTNLPPSITNAQKLTTMLNSLPSTSQIVSASDIGKSIRRHSQGAEQLLSWACNNYRGFLVSAQGRYRIPSMPNVHQFLLVDACPEIESRFARHNAYSAQAKQILFHGTSLDRLYPILAGGLKVMSHTQWMKHGAAQGAGVYLTTDPGVAWGVAAGMLSPHPTSNGPSFFQSRAVFQNAAVVLGCEYAGHNGARAGVHVVADASLLMVRYIFIFQGGTPAPRSQDITGPMLSTFNYLRSTVATSS